MLYRLSILCLFEIMYFKTFSFFCFPNINYILSVSSTSNVFTIPRIRQRRPILLRRRTSSDRRLSPRRQVLPGRSSMDLHHRSMHHVLLPKRQLQMRHDDLPRRQLSLQPKSETARRMLRNLFRSFLTLSRNQSKRT